MTYKIEWDRSGSTVHFGYVWASKDGESFERTDTYRIANDRQEGGYVLRELVDNEPQPVLGRFHKLQAAKNYVETLVFSNRVNQEQDADQ